MALALGTRLGPYEVTAQIGIGGMGEVYRARDTNLDRQVAIKILPDAFAHDPERLARFEREAKTLASLNHPNIATIHGLERADGVRALVMELVEGPTLADRIAQGPLPVDEALAVAKQIAEALEAAHDHGIIHRDLKPANIKLRPDGVVKVLDFGLAKALEPMSARGIDATISPTVTSPTMMTGIGVLLGTAAYMSPEQARGRVVDKRADIWAFGAVLYEMLTGKRAFDGEDVTDTLAAVVRSEPKWDALPDTVSPSVRVFLRRCLHKDSKQRIGDIRDVRLALEGVFETTVTEAAEATVAPARPPWRRHLVPVVASLVTAVVLSLAAWILRPATEAPLVSRFDVAALPEGVAFRNTGRPVMALSPDGRRLVLNTTAGLYVRATSELSSKPIPGTEDTLASPAFSPDGQSVVYFQGDQLKRIAISGGAPVVICGASIPFGISWARDNTILFGQPEGIMRVSAAGGMPELAIRAEKGEQVYGPQMLPDGGSVLFSVTSATGDTRWDQATIVVQSLRTGQRTVVLKGGSDARYVPAGYLVYALQSSLFAVAFDANQRQVQGGPVLVIQGVMRAGFPQVNTATAHYEISDRGTLVYVTGVAGGEIRRTLVWVDRTGQEEVIPAPPRGYQYPRISPDGTRVALDIRDQEGDIWIWDLMRQTLARLTFDPSGDNYPVWSPDSRRLIFNSLSARSGAYNLYWQSADGTGTPERLTDSPNAQFPLAMTPDGSAIVFREVNQEGRRTDLGVGGQNDLMRLLIGSHKLSGSNEISKTGTPLVRTKFNEANADISPDGRWLAYQSDESGREEVYVRPFPDVDSGRWQVSTGGGRTPVWARSGDELFFWSPPDSTIQSVRVERSSSWRSSTPTKVLQGLAYYGGTGSLGRTFDVAGDGKRFLMIKPGSSDAAPQSQKLIFVQNWDQELKRLVPTK